LPVSGDRLERYIVRHLLGKGGLALVYLVTDHDTARRFALKVLAPADPRVDTGMYDLARTLARLRHPNLVQFHDLLDVGGHPGLLYDLVEGPSLEDRLARGALAPDEVEHLLVGIGEALSYLHGRGLVHRDLKPGNVLLDTRGPHLVPLVADVGIARVLADTLGENAVRVGVLPGTPRYQAPEQLEGAPPEPRADLWALGALVYEMLTGRPPFRGADPIALRHAARQRDYPTLHSLAPRVPQRLVAAVDGALEPDPARRIGDVATFLEVASGADWPPRPPVPWPDPHPEPEEIRAGVVLGGQIRLGSLIGFDDLSETWRGVDQQDGEPVVVRALFRGTDSIARGRFKAAAASLRSVRHPSVARVRPSLVLERELPAFALVRDWVPGHSLAEELAGPRLGAGAVTATLADLLEVIGHLHAHNPPVIHRNLHPGNVVRASDGRLVVVDFGGPLAALTDPMQQRYALVGAFGYMAPEQLAGAATLGSDVYAAAAIAVTLLTRQPPRAMLDAEGRLDWTAHATVDPALRDVLEQMLATDPDRRPYAVHAAQRVRALLTGGIESPDELAVPLPPLEEDEPTDPSIPLQRTSSHGHSPVTLLDPPTDPALDPERPLTERPVVPPPRPRRSLRWVLVVLALLAAAALTTAWVAGSPHSSAPVSADPP